MDKEKLITRMVRFRERPFIDVLNHTMWALFPIVILGTIARLIFENFLSEDGYLANVLNVMAWLPQWRFFQLIFRDLTMVTIGWLTPFAAGMAALITTRRAHCENYLAPFLGMAAYVLVFFHHTTGNMQSVEMRYYGAAWLIIGVLAGYWIGLLFNHQYKKHPLKDGLVGFDQFHNQMVVVLEVLAIALLLHVIFALYRSFNLNGMVSQWFTSLLSRNSNYPLNIFLALVNTILIWLGFAQSISATLPSYGNEVSANIAYALSHKSPWHIPYPFTPSSLYIGFGVIGGMGISLALVLGILWLHKDRQLTRVAEISLIPGVFNYGLPVVTGVPLFLNPVFLIPFVLTPIMNIIIGSICIFVHLIPPLVFDVPEGTPGIMIPFMSSGGNWMALIIALLLLLLDVICYIPFIKLSLQVEQRYQEMKKEGTLHEN